MNQKNVNQYEKALFEFDYLSALQILRIHHCQVGCLLLYSIGLLGLAQGSVLSPSRKRFRSSDLQVMSLTRCLCATLLLRSYGGSRLIKCYSLKPVISFTGAQAPIRIRTGVSGFKVPSDNHYTIGATYHNFILCSYFIWKITPLLRHFRFLFWHL